MSLDQHGNGFIFPSKCRKFVNRVNPRNSGSGSPLYFTQHDRTWTEAKGGIKYAAYINQFKLPLIKYASSGHHHRSNTLG